MRSFHPGIFAIGLFGDVLEVVLWRRGSATAVRRRQVELESRSDGDDWGAAVCDLGPVLREMVAEIAAETGARVRRAFVVYSSPTAVGDCMSFPVHTAAQARSAASLAVIDSMKCSIETVVCETLFVERDLAPGGSSNGSGSGVVAASAHDRRPQRAHVVAAADCEDVLIAIQSMVERAALRFGGAVPVQAVIAAAGINRAADRHSTLAPAENDQSTKSVASPERGPTAHLHIGDAGSFLLVRESCGESRRAGNLRFTRSIPIGTIALAASLMRRSRRAEHEDPDHDDAIAPSMSESCVALDMEAARRALHEFGLPEEHHAVHEATGLTARDVLPLLQPLVQRMTVELRQSLRFALDAAERSRITFVVSGAGAPIPGLAAALGRELNIHAYLQYPEGSDLDEARAFDAITCDLRDAIDGWLSRSISSISELALLPRELARRCWTNRVRLGLWTGAAASLLLIALDAGRLASHIAHARLDHGAAAAMTPAAVTDRNPLLARVTNDPLAAIAFLDSARNFRALVDHETARRVDFRAAMHELSRITPRSVRFTNVNFQPNASGGDHRISGTIAGVARPSGDAPARTELERFIHDLRASPLFDDVALANVHVESDDSPNQRFEVRFSARPASTRDRWNGFPRDPTLDSAPGMATAFPPTEGGRE